MTYMYIENVDLKFGISYPKHSKKIHHLKNGMFNIF
jgi:hypothetical protein